MPEDFVEWCTDAISTYLINCRGMRLPINCFVSDNVNSTGGDDFYHNLEFYMAFHRNKIPLDYFKNGKEEKGNVIQVYSIHNESQSWAFEKSAEIIQNLHEKYLKIEKDFILFGNAFIIQGPTAHNKNLYSFEINLRR